MKIHTPSLRMRNNAGMDFPACYANAKLLDTDKGRLPMSHVDSEVTCERCRVYLGTSKRFALFRVRLNNGGYTDAGEYFGIGKPLYRFYATADEDMRQGYIRAYDRKDAKAQVLAQYPDAIFSR